jgi:hypothetical protein
LNIKIINDEKLYQFSFHSLGIEQKSDSEADSTTTTTSTTTEESSIETSPKNIIEDTTTHHETTTVVEIKPSKPIEEQSQSSSETGSINVESKDQEPQVVTKKPKKKKNKSTTPAPSSDAKFVVQAVSAVTPKSVAVVLSSPVESAKAVKENKFVVEAAQSLNEDEAFQSGEEGDEGEEVILQDGNTIGEPEYDFLSRQPTEFVEETYRVVNLKPTIKKPKLSGKTTQRPAADALHPTGLVTKSGGTVTGKDGLTTIHETSVIGTYISGKYAQVLQSTSQIYNGNQKPKINPTSTLRILKTAAPTFGNNKSVVTPAKADDDSQERTTRKLSYGNNNNNNNNGYKNRFRNREDNVEEITPSPPPSNTIGNNKKLSSSRRNNAGKNKRYVKLNDGVD